MIRGVGLRSAVAINVATMVGAGPFITLPLVVAALHGSVSAVAWVLGALIALCDGLVWAELASRYPRSGGTYTYLREAFGPRGPGRFVAFLFVWQFLFWAPLILASGYIGFAQYAAYLVPALAAPIPTHLVAVGVGIVTLAALYRAIPQIARAALVLGAVALVTLLVVAFAGLTHPYAPLAQTLPMTLNFSVGIVALGSALVITLYDYGGYGDVCALGDEVIAPVRTIPLAVVLSVLFVGVAYVLLNLGVAVAVPAKEIAGSNAIASLVAERAFGAPFAVAVTVAVLITAFGSTYGLLLGASRIPFAAARDGDFLAPFARLHPSGKFPAVSLIAIGLLALPASLLPLDAVINALTAGIVIVQGAGQVVALALARRTGSAPFRIPFYPLPPLIALAGWLYLFVSTGAVAIAFGLGTLAAGAAVFLVRARVVRIWPFATTTIASLLALAFIAAPASAAPTAVPTFGHAAIVRDTAGEPVLRVDGKPFFFLGGAFFYERIPRSEWRASMEAMRAIGANTLDLYVPWNWHELADGDFDFDGRTSPRRDLREVLRLGKELGFFFIVRPGPVIRNEWRNGGYPAWLLQRPEYRMELHDVLEGRYPATATLQNKQSDAAAAEWLGNATHKRYAARWLHRALAEFRPVADRVIAVQLDDDQAAYLDNDTYPAPHMHAYLRWLEAQVRNVVGPVMPTFVNTFESKVPSALPEWAMGNWYQSDAYAIGEHDRAELAFATATLRTQNRGPLAYSEFQAGWLAGPADPMPRAADPSNTALALGEIAGWGIKGLIDFPLQDTLAPFGWEAPFSNALYAWDAALTIDRLPGSRWGTTARLVRQLAFYGAALADAHRVADLALLYDGRTDPYAAASRLKQSLAMCRTAGITCDAIDPLAVSDARLASFRAVVVPAGTYPALAARLGRLHVPAIPSVAAFSGPKHATGVTVLRGAHGTFVVVENWSNSAVRYDATSLGLPAAAAAAIAPFSLASRDARIVAVGADLTFLSARYSPGDRITSSCPITAKVADEAVRFGVDQYDDALLHTFRDGSMCEVTARFGSRVRHWNLSSIQSLAPAPDAEVEARLFTIGGTFARVPYLHLAPKAQIRNVHVDDSRPPGIDAYRADVFEDGEQDVVLQNDRVIAIAAPAGGGRVVAFGEYAPRDTGPPTFLSSMFDATGALRDDVAIQPPPSMTDRIAKYTHDYPAGTFNRAYATCTFHSERGAGAYLWYDAPDVAPSGGRFEKLIMLASRNDRLIVDERFTPSGPAPAQRAVSLSAISTFRPATEQGYVVAGPDRLPIGRPSEIDPRSGGVTLESASAGDARVSVAWRPDDVTAASWTPTQSNGTIRLAFAPGGWRRVTYAFRTFASADTARGFGEAERAWVAANRPPSSENGEVAKWYTQSPQKRPSESSCGFESHLPQ
jgi:APA family basic amino acid/polyamine antiporter